MRAAMRVILAAFVVVGFASTVAAPPAAAQAPLPASGGDKWTYLVAPYFLFPNMDGTMTFGSYKRDVSASPDDIFDHLDFGFMIYSEARKGPLAIGFDILYMNLGQDGFTALGTYNVDAKQSGYMLTAYRRLSPRLEASLGLTLNHLSAGITTTGPLAIDRSNSKTWVDPNVGLRVELIRSPKWGLSFSGNVGGFGIGSDFAWQAYPVLCYHIESDLDLGLAYRAFGMDYDTGSGSDRFAYDVVTFGPELGVGFHF
jgi:hypothetical protein